MEAQPPQPPQETTEESKTPLKLVEVPVNNKDTALFLLVQFIGLAQKRGTFALDESAKIWECIQKFQKTE